MDCQSEPTVPPSGSRGGELWRSRDGALTMLTRPPAHPWHRSLVHLRTGVAFLRPMDSSLQPVERSLVRMHLGQQTRAERAGTMRLLGWHRLWALARWQRCAAVAAGVDFPIQELECIGRLSTPGAASVGAAGTSTSAAGSRASRCRFFDARPLLSRRARFALLRATSYLLAAASVALPAYSTKPKSSGSALGSKGWYGDFVITKLG